MSESTIERLLDDQPLLLFSLYTQIQSRILIELGQRICRMLDEIIFVSEVKASGVQEVYGMFWLWVLGAYEVIRTMSQHSNCFSSQMQSKLASVKKSLNLVRIPFAKQELKWKGRKIYAELSISKVDIVTKDIIFNIEGKDIYVRQLVCEFVRFITGIKRDDIKYTITLSN